MKVFLNGCFDLLHPGHFNNLTYARQLVGDEGQVIVGIDQDEKTMIDKGINRPVFDENERAAALLALKIGDRPLVDTVEFFNTNLMLLHLIRKHRPDFIVKGSDWAGNIVGGDEPYVKVVLFPRMQEYSTTEIIRRVLEKNKST